MKKIFLVLLFLLAVSAFTTISADKIVLKNGAELEGKISFEDNESITINIDSGSDKGKGRVNVKKHEIKKIIRDDKITEANIDTFAKQEVYKNRDYRIEFTIFGNIWVKEENVDKIGNWIVKFKDKYNISEIVFSVESASDPKQFKASLEDSLKKRFPNSQSSSETVFTGGVDAYRYYYSMEQKKENLETIQEYYVIYVLPYKGNAYILESKITRQEMGPYEEMIVNTADSFIFEDMLSELQNSHKDIKDEKSSEDFYTNELLGVEFEVNKNVWKKDKNVKDDAVVYVHSTTLTRFMFVAEKLPLDKKLTLDEYIVEYEKKENTQPEKITIGGIDGLKTKYLEYTTEKPIWNLTAFTIKNGVVYKMIFIVPSDKIEDAETVIDKVIASFKFTK